VEVQPPESSGQWLQGPGQELNSAAWGPAPEMAHGHVRPHRGPRIVENGLCAGQAGTTVKLRPVVTSSPRARTRGTDREKLGPICVRVVWVEPHYSRESSRGHRRTRPCLRALMARLLYAPARPRADGHGVWSSTVSGHVRGAARRSLRSASSSSLTSVNIGVPGAHNIVTVKRSGTSGRLFPSW
jgi:hypothetical protein